MLSLLGKTFSQKNEFLKNSYSLEKDKKLKKIFVISITMKIKV